MRKNVNIPDDLLERIERVRFDGHYPTETAAICDLLGLAEAEIRGQRGYVYLADIMGNRTAYKIGYSADPHSRMQTLASETKSAVSLVGLIRGGRLMERHAHILFSDLLIGGEFFERREKIAAWFAKSELAVDPDMVKRRDILSRTVQLPAWLWDALKETADKERRSVQGQIAVILESQLTQGEGRQVEAAR